MFAYITGDALPATRAFTARAARAEADANCADARAGDKSREARESGDGRAELRPYRWRYYRPSLVSLWGEGGGRRRQRSPFSLSFSLSYARIGGPRGAERENEPAATSAETRACNRTADNLCK